MVCHIEAVRFVISPGADLLAGLFTAKLSLCRLQAYLPAGASVNPQGLLMYRDVRQHDTFSAILEKGIEFIVFAPYTQQTVRAADGAERVPHEPSSSDAGVRSLRRGFQMEFGSIKPGEFRSQLSAALANALEEIFVKIGNESMYAFSLYTSGESDYSYVSASANTEEALSRTIREYTESDPDFEQSLDAKKIRWSTPDWGYHDFSEIVAALELPEGEGRKRDTALYRDFIYCLKKVKQLEGFRDAKSRVMFLVTCGDMSEEFFQRGMKQLNEPGMVKEYVEEYTAAPYLNWLRSLPADSQMATAISLYHDLALGIPSAPAKDAFHRNVNQYELRPLLAELDEKGVTRLLDLVERYGFGPIFNQKGSLAFEKHGAFTVENNLCTSTVFLIAQCISVNESHVRRLQEILLKRVQADRPLSITSTLSENIARVLHRLRPGRFPQSHLNPTTNHLENPEPFLRG